MGRHSCCYKQKLRKGLWSPEEDEKLLRYITKYGHGCWSSIAAQLPGRTDNEIKNLWNSSLKKKLRLRGIDPVTHKLLTEIETGTDDNTTPVEKCQTTYLIETEGSSSTTTGSTNHNNSNTDHLYTGNFGFQRLSLETGSRIQTGIWIPQTGRNHHVDTVPSAVVLPGSMFSSGLTDSTTGYRSSNLGLIELDNSFSTGPMVTEQQLQESNYNNSTFFGTGNLNWGLTMEENQFTISNNSLQNHSNSSLYSEIKSETNFFGTEAANVGMWPSSLNWAWPTKFNLSGLFIWRSTLARDMPHQYVDLRERESVVFVYRFRCFRPVLDSGVASALPMNVRLCFWEAVASIAPSSPAFVSGR
ncbi:hypothetical protein YC2023_104856 [Brassica napus]